MATVTKGFDARLANRTFLVYDFRALWRATVSARVPESQKLKMVGYQPGIKSLSHCRHFGTLGKKVNGSLSAICTEKMERKADASRS